MKQAIRESEAFAYRAQLRQGAGLVIDGVSEMLTCIWLGD
jgi:hypothetical protein